MKPRAAAALVAGIAAGWVASRIGVPLPWMLGPLFAVALIAVTLGDPRPPGWFMSAARPVIGVTAGSTFLPSVLAGIAGWWPALALTLVFMAIVMIGGMIFFRAVVGMKRASAFFAALPGGLTEMTSLGQAAGGDMRALILAHSVRMVLTVILTAGGLALLAPGLLRPPAVTPPPPGLVDWAWLIGAGGIGAGIGLWLRSASLVMLLPMAISAVVHATGLTDSRPPWWLVAAVQVMIGVSAGARFAGAEWRAMSRLAALSALWTVMMMLLAALLAGIGTLISPLSFVALLLGLAPGGASEMIVIALALGAEVAAVVACHVFRLLLILGGAPAMWEFVRRRIP